MRRWLLPAERAGDGGAVAEAVGRARHARHQRDAAHDAREAVPVVEVVVRRANAGVDDVRAHAFTIAQRTVIERAVELRRRLIDAVELPRQRAVRAARRVLLHRDLAGTEAAELQLLILFDRQHALVPRDFLGDLLGRGHGEAAQRVLPDRSDAHAMFPGQIGRDRSRIRDLRVIEQDEVLVGDLAGLLFDVAVAGQQRHGKTDQ
jgi:hypothetical protein